MVSLVSIFPRFTLPDAFTRLLEKMYEIFKQNFAYKRKTNALGHTRI